MLNLNKIAKKKVKFLRYDNSGENIKYLTPICKANGMTPERTSPNTPQYNGQVERKIPDLWRGARKLITAAHLTHELRRKLWPHAWRQSERLLNMSCGAMNFRLLVRLFVISLVLLILRSCSLLTNFDVLMILCSSVVPSIGSGAFIFLANVLVAFTSKT